MTNTPLEKNSELIRKIGQRIGILRKEKGLSREELAFKIGISHQQLFKYEIGENRITVDRLILIALALDIRIINFFDAIGDKIGLQTLITESDYRLIKNLSQLKKLTAEEVISKIIELIT